MPSKASSVHFLMFSCVWRSDFIAALLDPRFKKLKFKHDGMLQDRRRREALKWLSDVWGRHLVVTIDGDVKNTAEDMLR